MTENEENKNHLADAAREATRRDRLHASDPEPPLSKRFAQIGILGWVIVIPVLVALLLGSWLDGLLGTGITLSAAFTLVGAVLGLWLALRWMHEQ